jgi:hypothetical protein
MAELRLSSFSFACSAASLNSSNYCLVFSIFASRVFSCAALIPATNKAIIATAATTAATKIRIAAASKRVGGHPAYSAILRAHCIAVCPANEAMFAAPAVIFAQIAANPTLLASVLAISPAVLASVTAVSVAVVAVLTAVAKVSAFSATVSASMVVVFKAVAPACA